MNDICRNEMTAPCGCLVEALAACECYDPARPPLSVAEALAYAATLRPGELTEGSESEVVATLAAEVKELAASRAQVGAQLTYRTAERNRLAAEVEHLRAIKERALRLRDQMPPEDDRTDHGRGTARAIRVILDEG